MNSFDPMLRKGDVVRAEGLFRRLYHAAPEQQRRVMFNTLLKANFDQQNFRRSEDLFENWRNGLWKFN